MLEPLLKRDSDTNVLPVNFAKFLRTPFSQNTFGDCFFLNADAPMDSQSRFKEGREREKKETSGAYTGPCQRYVMEFFSEYSQRFFAGHIQKKFSLRYLTGS